MKVRSMVLSGLFAALNAVCAWLTVPIADIAFTMQTFGVFLTLGLLGGKWGSVSLIAYILLGVAGLPVFMGFQGGVGVLFGVTGGYIWGFLVSAAVYALMVRLLGEKTGSAAGMVLGLFTCYTCGSLWYCFGYLGGGFGFWAVVLKCVVPYLVPDGLKLTLAWILSRKLKKFAY